MTNQKIKDVEGKGMVQWLQTLAALSVDPVSFSWCRHRHGGVLYFLLMIFYYHDKTSWPRQF